MYAHLTLTSKPNPSQTSMPVPTRFHGTNSTCVTGPPTTDLTNLQGGKRQIDPSDAKTLGPQGAFFFLGMKREGQMLSCRAVL